MTTRDYPHKHIRMIEEVLFELGYELIPAGTVGKQGQYGYYISTTKIRFVVEALSELSSDIRHAWSARDDIAGEPADEDDPTCCSVFFQKRGDL